MFRSLSIKNLIIIQPNPYSLTSVSWDCLINTFILVKCLFTQTNHTFLQYSKLARFLNFQNSRIWKNLNNCFYTSCTFEKHVFCLQNAAVLQGAHPGVHEQERGHAGQLLLHQGQILPRRGIYCTLHSTAGEKISSRNLRKIWILIKFEFFKNVGNQIFSNANFHEKPHWIFALTYISQYQPIRLRMLVRTI